MEQYYIVLWCKNLKLCEKVEKRNVTDNDNCCIILVFSEKFNVIGDVIFSKDRTAIHFCTTTKNGIIQICCVKYHQLKFLHPNKEKMNCSSSHLL